MFNYDSKSFIFKENKGKQQNFNEMGFFGITNLIRNNLIIKEKDGKGLNIQ